MTEAGHWGQADSFHALFLVGGLFEPVFIHHLDTIFFSLLAMIAALWCSAFPDARFPGSGLRLTGRSQRP